MLRCVNHGAERRKDFETEIIADGGASPHFRPCLLSVFFIIIEFPSRFLFYILFFTEQQISSLRLTNVAPEAARHRSVKPGFLTPPPTQLWWLWPLRVLWLLPSCRTRFSEIHPFVLVAKPRTMFCENEEKI